MDSDAAFQIRTAGQVGPTGRPLPDFPEPQPLTSHGPARIIAMCNQKGGVGKTTTTINLGAALAEYGRRVLLVDFDPQGALSVGLGVPVNELDVTVYNLLIERGHDVRDVIKHTRSEGLDVLPANIDLSAAEVQLVGEVAREQILARVLRPVVDDYDVVLIDCQPSLGLLTVNALTAAHGVHHPARVRVLRACAASPCSSRPSRRSATGSTRASRSTASSRRCTTARTLHSREVVASVVEHFGDQVFHTVISRTVKFPDASRGGRADHDLRRHPQGRRRLPAARPRAHRPRWGGLTR